MTCPITLLSGQWADVPLAELAPLARQMGYEGLELACSGEHFNAQAALADPGYIERQRALLAKHDLRCFAVSNHLVGQAGCNPINTRHRAILPPEVWKDGDPEGVRQRATQAMEDTAHAAAHFGVRVVTGFTGLSVWHSIYTFPPTNQAYWEAGFEDFARPWLPVLDVFDEVGGNFALEIHLPKIAFDTVSARWALTAVNHHPYPISASTTIRATSPIMVWTTQGSSAPFQSGSSRSISRPYGGDTATAKSAFVGAIPASATPGGSRTSVHWAR